MRGATDDSCNGTWLLIFQPTRPLRGATFQAHPVFAQDDQISTHAPLAGRDTSSPSHSRRRMNFNPRAPCGARLTGHRLKITVRVFQPTRPLRGATGRGDGGTATTQNFNPRAPCGARPAPSVTGAINILYFNPRAPCGARPHLAHRPKFSVGFQPTRPLRGATAQPGKKRADRHISTHAPLAGRDVGKIYKDLVSQISTHAPLAGRDGERVAVYAPAQISTHAPLAGRDAHRPRGDRRSEISTHAPLAGRDQRSTLLFVVLYYFNPRAPCGARRRSVEK